MDVGAERNAIERHKASVQRASLRAEEKVDFSSSSVLSPIPHATLVGFLITCGIRSHPPST
jgi:hypothetical protein